MYIHIYTHVHIYVALPKTDNKAVYHVKTPINDIILYS